MVADKITTINDNISSVDNANGVHAVENIGAGDPVVDVNIESPVLKVVKNRVQDSIDFNISGGAGSTYTGDASKGIAIDADNKIGTTCFGVANGLSMLDGGGTTRFDITNMVALDDSDDPEVAANIRIGETGHGSQLVLRADAGITYELKDGKTGVLPVSVNGEVADENGNIVVSAADLKVDELGGLEVMDDGTLRTTFARTFADGSPRQYELDITRGSATDLELGGDGTSALTTIKGGTIKYKLNTESPSGQTGFLPLTVNGQVADAAGNVVVATGGTYTADEETGITIDTSKNVIGTNALSVVAAKGTHLVKLDYAEGGTRSIILGTTDSGVDVSLQGKTFEYKKVGDDGAQTEGYLPLTVNGVVADSNGNISISSGGDSVEGDAGTGTVVSTDGGKKKISTTFVSVTTDEGRVEIQLQGERDWNSVLDPAHVDIDEVSGVNMQSVIPNNAVLTTVTIEGLVNNTNGFTISDKREMGLKFKNPEAFSFFPGSDVSDIPPGTHSFRWSFDAGNAAIDYQQFDGFLYLSFTATQLATLDFTHVVTRIEYTAPVPVTELRAPGTDAMLVLANPFKRLSDGSAVALATMDDINPPVPIDNINFTSNDGSVTINKTGDNVDISVPKPIWTTGDITRDFGNEQAFQDFLNSLPPLINHNIICHLQCPSSTFHINKASGTGKIEINNNTNNLSFYSFDASFVAVPIYLNKMAIVGGEHYDFSSCLYVALETLQIGAGGTAYAARVGTRLYIMRPQSQSSLASQSSLTVEHMGIASMVFGSDHFDLHAHTGGIIMCQDGAKPETATVDKTQGGAIFFGGSPTFILSNPVGQRKHK